MTDHPIIFSAPMVRALLDGRKTMTRRLAWVQRKSPPRPHARSMPADLPAIVRQGYEWVASEWQKAQAGDRLWVRESHYVESAGYKDGSGRRINYRATEPDAPNGWTPSIHMPRWASRLTLDVTAVKVERLQDISEDDALAEGMAEPYLGDGDPPFTEQAVTVTRRMQFRNLWRQLHGAGSWDANPEVVAISFTVRKTNIDAKEAA